MTIRCEFEAGNNNKRAVVAEALNIANQLCQYGYFFPVSDSKNLVVKDDSSLYRFQVRQWMKKSFLI